MINHFDRKELKKLKALFIPFLIFVGCLKLILFYYLFGIKIVNYLNFTEVLVSFLDTAIYYLFILFAPIFIMLSFWGDAISKENNKIFRKKVEMSFRQRIKMDFKQYFLFILLYLVLFIFAIIKGTWNLQGFLQVIFNPGIFILFFLIRELRITYKKQFNYEIPVTYVNLFLFSYLFIMVIVQNVLSEMKSITKDYKYYGTTAIIGTDTIISDSTITYVGQTHEFIFFSNLKTSENIVYPKRDLKKIIIKKK